MKHAVWLADAKAQYGLDSEKWRFQCAQCGEVYSGAECGWGIGANRAAQECIGRFKVDRGCDYATFGLIQVDGLIEIEMLTGKKVYVMPFAEVARV